jgi:hypothetical protein
MEESCLRKPEHDAHWVIHNLRERVETCLREVETDMEGYPVEPLLRNLVQAFDQSAASRAETLKVTESLLSFWIESLEHEMMLLAPPSPPVLLSIRAKMQAAQTALTHVLNMIDALKCSCSLVGHADCHRKMD